MGTENGPDVPGTCAAILDHIVSDGQLNLCGFEHDKLGGGIVLYYLEALNWFKQYFCSFIRKQTYTISMFQGLTVSYKLIKVISWFT